jgi:hypothetical protein
LDGYVSPLVIARWEDLQAEIRNLSVQRGLRFVAASVLAPFGAANVGNAQPGPHVPALAFGVALFLLAVAEMAAIAESRLHVKARKQLEKEYPALAPEGDSTKMSRLLSHVSGPAYSTALYALLGAAVIVANRMG